MKINIGQVLLQILFGLILGAFIISFSVVFTLNFRPLYYADMQVLNISQTSGYSDEEIRENYDVLIDYNQLFNHDELEFPTLTMSVNGKTHFEEVKVIFDLFGYVSIATFVLSVIAVIISHIRKQWLYLKIAGIIDIILPVILGILVFFNWNYVFVTFHHIAFNNDYWIFDSATDPVIDILPDEFFMHCAIMIFVMIFVMSLICLTVCKIKTLKRRLALAGGKH